MPIINKSQLSGTVTIPSSKSYIHRYLICAALANKKTILKGLFEGNDIQETICAIRELGIKVEKKNNEILIDSTAGISVQCPRLQIKESGATFRFILPVLATYCNEYTIKLGDRLKERPHEELIEFLNMNGAIIRLDGATIRGKKINRYIHKSFKSVKTSQPISGLMMVAHYANLKLDFKSVDNVFPYVVMTRDAIKKFDMSNGEIIVPGDSSTEAIYRALNLIGDKIYIKGFANDCIQPDAEFNNILKMIGSKFKNTLRGSYNTSVSAIGDLDIDIKRSVDLIFSALYLAIHNCSVTNLRGIARTKYKESNRILESIKILDELKVKYSLYDDCLRIYSNDDWLKKPHYFDSSSDHRCDMLKVMICLRTGGEMEGFGSIDKSHPSFIQNLIRCGAEIKI